jgi:hypothetical protein
MNFLLDGQTNVEVIFMQEDRLKELVKLGKKRALTNKELVELISLVGPDEALEAFRQGNRATP